MLGILQQLLPPEGVAIAAFSLIGGIIGALLKGLFERRRVEAEAQRIRAEATSVEASAIRPIMEGTDHVIDLLREELVSLKAKVNALEIDLSAARKEIGELREQLFVASRKEAILNAQIEQLKGQLTESQTRERALNIQVRALEAENVDLRARLDAAEHRISELQQHVREGNRATPTE